MKLQEAIRIGKGLDFTTIEECVDSIHSHSPQLFPYSKINEELDELYKEYDDYKKNPESWMIALCGVDASEEQQMALYEEELKTNDSGHRPC